MGIVYVLLPISLFLALLGFLAYFWALKRGQFDDLDTPARRILLEDDNTEPGASVSKKLEKLERNPQDCGGT